MTRTISLRDLQFRFNLAPDEEIVVENGGQPLARIIPPQASGGAATGAPEFGFWAGQISTTPDFDEPLPDAFWLGEE